MRAWRVTNSFLRLPVGCCHNCCKAFRTKVESDGVGMGKCSSDVSPIRVLSLDSAHCRMNKSARGRKNWHWEDTYDLSVCHQDVRTSQHILKITMSRATASILVGNCLIPKVVLTTCASPPAELNELPDHLSLIVSLCPSAARYTSTMSSKSSHDNRSIPNAPLIPIINKTKDHLIYSPFLSSPR